MASLPLFKFVALFVRHISKYGGNLIKTKAHDHPKFRVYAAKYGQRMHQLNMRMAVTLLKNSTAEKRLKENSEELSSLKPPNDGGHGNLSNTRNVSNEKSLPKEVPPSVWKRKFRPLPEAKAVELFANVVGDSFVLLVAGSLVFYEYLRTKGKPDISTELKHKLDELEQRESDLEKVNKQTLEKVEALEVAIVNLEKNISKK
ncbi:putative opa3-like protein [Golovinomyces cichoracearum]|uniref:Putative opa3-like protein n=1 Tax=Golovinomyces cichoracearum TaxID=62708 RepID=A0A420HIX9_9PEZI|nr:putative opa3-like protein [Golovinomyces cichoracearum]